MHSGVAVAWRKMERIDVCAPGDSTCLFLSGIKELFHMNLLLFDRSVLFIQGHVEIEEVVVEDFEGEQRSRGRKRGGGRGQTCEWLH